MALAGDGSLPELDASLESPFGHDGSEASALFGAPEQSGGTPDQWWNDVPSLSARDGGTEGAKDGTNARVPLPPAPSTSTQTDGEEGAGDEQQEGSVLSVFAVPEPGAMLLIGIGLAAVARRLRRSRQD